MEAERIRIRTESIAVDALLKFVAVAGTGGEAKSLVQAGQVRVNGQTETHRGRRLAPGDRVEILGPDEEIERTLLLVADTDTPDADREEDAP